MVFTPPQAARPWTFRLLVLTAAGILTSIGIIGNAALDRRADTRSRAALVADLRRFDAAQRARQAQRGEFARAFDSTGSDSSVAFTASRGVDFVFESHSAQAWSATAKAPDESELVAPRTCGIYRGEGAIAPHRALTIEGAVVCW